MRDNLLSLPNVNEFEIGVNSKVAIFVHWSKKDIISKHDIDLINTIALEFDHVFVVCNLNNSRNRTKKSLAQFHTNVHFIYRSNLGYDFGAYQAGLSFLRPISPNIDEILLMNNSVFKLKHSLTSLMEMVRASSFDATAITNSRENKLHLQTYFLHLKKSIYCTCLKLKKERCILTKILRHSLKV